MEIKSAIYNYCRYQERCHQEVRNKLYELGGYTQQVEQLIAELVEAGLLNEERYARAFARGKFRIKQWGKRKIIQHLKHNRISDYCINRSLTEIDPDEYEATLKKLLDKKYLELKGEKSTITRNAKLYRYLLQKGYEQDMIIAFINELIR